MVEQLYSWLTSFISREMAVTLVSMIPFIELRGGIVLAHGLGMDPWWSFVICVLANCVPIPFAIWLTRPVFDRLKKTKRFGNFVHKLEVKLMKKSDQVTAYKYAAIGLMLFVGVPLPGTGAYSGSLIAALLGMRVKQAVPAIVAGVILAGIIMTVASMGLFGALDIFM